MDQGGADDLQKDAGKSLVDFTKDVGIPERLVTDGATEFTGRHTELITEVRRMRIMLHAMEEGHKMRIMRRNRDESFESEMTLNYKQVVLRSLHPGMRPRRRKSWQRGLAGDGMRNRRVREDPDTVYRTLTASMQQRIRRVLHPVEPE
jgi:hypothetical protein